MGRASCPLDLPLLERPEDGVTLAFPSPFPLNQAFYWAAQCCFDPSAKAYLAQGDVGFGDHWQGEHLSCAKLSLALPPHP